MLTFPNQLNRIRDGVPIVISEIAEHAGVLGAAMMMKVHLQKHPPVSIQL